MKTIFLSLIFLLTESSAHADEQGFRNRMQNALDAGEMGIFGAQNNLEMAKYYDKLRKKAESEGQTGKAIQYKWLRDKENANAQGLIDGAKENFNNARIMKGRLE